MKAHAIRRYPAVLSLIGCLTAPWPASALTIAVTDPNPHYTDTESPAAPHSWAKVTAHLWTNSISLANDLYFEDAWKAWNDPRPAADKWTLVNGGALNATVNVTIFDAKSFHNNGHAGNAGVGGVEVKFELVYNGADRDDFVWSQGLYVNYKPGNFGLFPPYSAMDTASLSGLTPGGNIWADPVYPYQYNDESFYDYPKAPYDWGFFEADALLSKVDYANKKLTVYEGVHYGFYLSVPEGGNVLTLLVVTVTIGWFGQRSRRGRKA